MRAIRGIGMTARMTDWQDDAQIEKIKGLKISMTRYPAGKDSADFNWRTGKAWGHKNHHVTFSVTELKRWMDKCHIPRVMLVVSIYQGVDVVLDYLRLARDSGVPVKFITLGNETYGDGQDFKGVPMKWDGQKYKQKCKKLIPKIREEFPEAKIYAQAIGKRGNTTIQNEWNSWAIQLEDLVDGYDTHIYITAGKDLDWRMGKYNLWKIDTKKEMIFGEYGSKNFTSPGMVDEIFELRKLLEKEGTIALNYCLVGFRDDRHGKVKKDNSYTPEGEEWKARTYWWYWIRTLIGRR